MIVAYSSVAPGDKIRGHLIYRAKRPGFPGEFARYWSEPADQPPEVVELTLDGPASGHCMSRYAMSNTVKKRRATGSFITCASDRKRRSND
jgi:hypothetical protein